MTRIEALKHCHEFMRTFAPNEVGAYHKFRDLVGRERYINNSQPGLYEIMDIYKDDPLAIQTELLKHLEPLITDEGNDADPSTNAGDR